MKTITIDGIAQLCHVTPRTAERYARIEDFPKAMRPGGTTRIWDEAEVIEWLKQQREDAELISDLKNQYDTQDGSELDPAPIEFVTPEDLVQIDEVLSGQIGIHDADTDWLEGLLEKVKTLASLQQSGEVFPVMGAARIKAKDLPASLAGRVFQPNYYDPEADWAGRGAQ